MVFFRARFHPAHSSGPGEKRLVKGGWRWFRQRPRGRTVRKLYDRKNALVAADTLNDRVLPFFEEQDIALLRMLTDRGTEYCGNREAHEYQLYLAVENIDHTRTKAKSPQTNGICERFHRTIQEEFYAVAFRKKLYRSLEQLQEDVDEWIAEYNGQRSHSGKYCYGKTPLQTFLDSRQLAWDRLLDRQSVLSSSGSSNPTGAEGAGSPTAA